MNESKSAGGTGISWRAFRTPLRLPMPINVNETLHRCRSTASALLVQLTDWSSAPLQANKRRQAGSDTAPVPITLLLFPFHSLCVGEDCKNIYFGYRPTVGSSIN